MKSFGNMMLHNISITFKTCRKEQTCFMVRSHHGQNESGVICKVEISHLIEGVRLVGQQPEPRDQYPVLCSSAFNLR